MTIREEIHSLYVREVPKLLARAAADPEIAYHLREYCCPFVPYVGEGYEASPLRIVVVGKAPNGWGDDQYKTLEGLCNATVLPQFCDWSRRFVCDDYVLPYFGNGRVAEQHLKYRSPFWRQIYCLVPAILGRTPLPRYEKSAERAEQCFRGIAWTNVFKIGGTEGNPDPAMCRFLCGERLRGLLTEELEILRPDVVLFSTGPSYDNFLGSMGLHIAQALGNIAPVTNLGPRTVGLRSFHFQYGRFKPSVLLDRVLLELSNATAVA